MDHVRYLELLQEDAARLLTSAREAGPGAPVPSCPGWSVRDLLDHVSLVYRHKVECIRRQADPEPWPPERSHADPFAELEDALAALLAELAAHAPGDPAFTWHEPDQTVGFWARRMAQETVVHRVDAQLAAGEEVSEVAEDLAGDGINEVLHVLVEGDWPDLPLPGPGPDRVALRVPGRSWTVVDAPDRLEVHDGDQAHGDQASAGQASAGQASAGQAYSGQAYSGQASADVVVEGAATDVLLWAWGRADTTALAVSGDQTALARLQQRLAVATG